MSNNELQRLQATQGNLNEKIGVGKEADKFDPFQQAILELELQMTNDPQDKKQVRRILQILQYPSTKITQIHVAAHRLGNRDEQVDGLSVEKRNQLAKTAVICPCCSIVMQQSQLKLCHSLDAINNLGLSTFLYFQSLKNLSIILVEMLLIYAIFALATNIIASGKYTDCTTVTDCSANLDYLSISLGSKQLNPTEENQSFYYAQCWIGVVMIIVWFITFAILKYWEKLKEIQVDLDTKSASDFAILIEGLPDDVTQKQFEDQLKIYQQKIHKLTSIPLAKKKPFKVAKFNKGKAFFMRESDFKDQELQKLQQENKKIKEQFGEWILERQSSHSFSQTKEQKKALFKKYEENIEALKKRITQLSQQMKNKLNESKSDQNPVFFVTLDSNLAKNLIVQLNPRQYSARIRNFLTCANTGNHFDFDHEGTSLNLKIERAPEPEDIIWTNIGLTDCQKIFRKLVTFTITALILGLSFLAVYGLSVAQINNADDRFLSILISVIISLINVIISQAIRYLSIYERDYTIIKYQTSFAIKSVLASLVNSILIPIVANRFIKKNIYEQNGLADDIFMLGLTNAFVPPILKIIDGGYFFFKIMKWLNRRPKSKLPMTQIQHNAYQTNIEFQIGYEYVYVVHLYLFVCFFVSLQPVICIFAVIGYFIMFWAQKWSLFNRTRRPIPGNDLINTALNQLIFFGPIIYSLGSLTWVNFFPQGTPKYALIPNLVAVGISVIMWILPLSLIFSCFLNGNQEPEMKYSDNRIYLPAQYDRLNPSTAQEGLKDYMDYLENFGKAMQGKSKQDKQKMAQMLMKQQQRGCRTNGPQQSPFTSQGMNSFFAPRPQPYMMVPQMMPMMQPMMQPMMNPMMPMMRPMAPMMNPMMMQQQLRPMQSFNPFGSGINSGFMPQQPSFGPSGSQFQPRPVIQQNPSFIPPQPNVQGFGQPQNQFAPIGFNGNQQAQSQISRPNMGQPPGFNLPPPGFNQQAPGFNQQPPGFNQGQGFGQAFNPFNR